MEGLLLVNKPAGISSYDVIRRLKASLSKAGESVPKIGHAGTLDPLASGLLIVLIGKATKSQQNFMKQPKVYLAQITLGAESSTDDAEGVLTRINKQEIGSKTPSQNEVQKILRKFKGKIMQVPPVYSAIKVKGRRAYQSARRGQTVELKARPVIIHELKVLKYEYPILEIEVKVSSGTYIRSLARDIGQALGSGAYLSGLSRTQIGGFSLSDAIDPIGFSPVSVRQNLRPV